MPTYSSKNHNKKGTCNNSHFQRNRTKMCSKCDAHTRQEMQVPNTKRTIKIGTVYTSTGNVTLFGSMHSVLSDIVMYSISESWTLS